MALHDLPAAHAQDSVTECPNSGVVGNDGGCCARFAIDILKDGQHQFACFCIQRAGGFVTQQNRRAFLQSRAQWLPVAALRRKAVMENDPCELPVPPVPARHLLSSD